MNKQIGIYMLLVNLKPDKLAGVVSEGMYNVQKMKMGY